MSRRSTVRRRRGYTLIEVMVAVAILAAGASGVLAMHEAAVSGNYAARQFGTSTNLVATWVERLRIDGLRWTTGVRRPNSPTDPFSQPMALGGTQWLQNVPLPGTPATWFTPAAATPFGGGPVLSPAFDHWGRDVANTGAANVEYCTNVRLEWIYFGSAMRADVRVWHLRRNPVNPVAGCPANANAVTTNDAHFAYASTVLRWTPRPTP